jgi:DNA-directed RNA polymerase subunit beta'
VIASVLDKIKALGFRYATKAGITISKNDIVIPQEKDELLAGYERRSDNVEGLYERGLITEEERHEQIVTVWTEATEDVPNGDGEEPPRAEPDLHDGQLRRPRIVQADPPARRQCAA